MGLPQFEAYKMHCKKLWPLGPVGPKTQQQRYASYEAY